MKELNRRDFLYALGLCGSALGGAHLDSAPLPSPKSAKPIMGSWFEFQHHHPPEGTPWNPACASFTCQQWDTKVKEIADLGME